ncbi:hypothetical protein JAAARDRAFT_31606 [Jaapia argillacea MUCL 33604]|uniref:Uncharacterized protein n=1 Tax=Jaapia argillacea MUCL 33604 TaxID=933084 RepID=A0A067QAV8_9AGAM|nr:hypothetical protein JAAARDRAFT_31606 [Jaapia argillacea MUCL 33604]
MAGLPAKPSFDADYPPRRYPPPEHPGDRRYHSPAPRRTMPPSDYYSGSGYRSPPRSRPPPGDVYSRDRGYERDRLEYDRRLQEDYLRDQRERQWDREIEMEKEREREARRTDRRLDIGHHGGDWERVPAREPAQRDFEMKKRERDMDMEKEKERAERLERKQLMEGDFVMRTAEKERDRRAQWDREARETHRDMRPPPHEYDRYAYDRDRERGYRRDRDDHYRGREPEPTRGYEPRSRRSASPPRRHYPPPEPPSRRRSRSPDTPARRPPSPSHVHHSRPHSRVPSPRGRTPPPLPGILKLGNHSIHTRTPSPQASRSHRGEPSARPERVRRDADYERERDRPVERKRYHSRSRSRSPSRSRRRHPSRSQSRDRSAPPKSPRVTQETRQDVAPAVQHAQEPTPPVAVSAPKTSPLPPPPILNEATPPSAPEEPPSKDKGKSKEIPSPIPDRDADGDIKMRLTDPIPPPRPAPSPPKGPRAQLANESRAPSGPSHKLGRSPTRPPRHGSYTFTKTQSSQSQLQPQTQSQVQSPTTPTISSPQLPSGLPAKPKADWGPSAAAGPSNMGRRVTMPLQVSTDKGALPSPRTPIPLSASLPEGAKTIPKYSDNHPSLTKDIDAEIALLRAHRIHLASERAQITLSARKAMHELEFSNLDLKLAESRRKIADIQFQKAKAGALGIDYVKPVVADDTTVEKNRVEL